MEIPLSPGLLMTLVILGIWELIWKAIALWHSAQRRHKVWFVLILIINSAGILPIVYLLTHKNKR